MSATEKMHEQWTTLPSRLAVVGRRVKNVPPMVELRDAEGCLGERLHPVGIDDYDLTAEVVAVGSHAGGDEYHCLIRYRSVPTVADWEAEPLLVVVGTPSDLTHTWRRVRRVDVPAARAELDEERSRRHPHCSLTAARITVLDEREASRWIYRDGKPCYPLDEDSGAARPPQEDSSVFVAPRAE